MKKYRYRLMYYLLYVVIIIFNLGTILFFKNWFVIILGSLCICASIVDIINKFMFNIYIDKAAIIEQSILRKKVIYFNEIERIIKLPTSKGKKIFIGIYGTNNKIFVTFWISNYKDLIKLIVDKCSDSENIWIDPRVIQLLIIK